MEGVEKGDAATGEMGLGRLATQCDFSFAAAEL
jgi:hypothetical protein